MANLTTTADIKADVLRNAGELQDGTSRYDSRALELINQAYRQILSASSFWKVDLAKPWPWAKAKYPLILELEAPYTTGTIAVTNGSASITFSAGPAASKANWYLKIDGHDRWYRLDAHIAAGTAATLDSLYLGTTAAAATYTLVKLDYTLPPSGSTQILRLISPMLVQADQPISTEQDNLVTGLDNVAFRTKFPVAKLEEGIPDKFTIIHEVDGVLTVRFNRYPPARVHIEADYIPVPAALTVLPYYEDCSITIASPGVVTLASHGLASATPVKFDTNGALPTGLVAGTTYYVEPIDTNTFYLHATSGLLSRINTSGTQSGIHSVQAQSPTDSTPIIPVEYRDVLSHAATYFLMTEKSDQRAKDRFALTQAALSGMVEGYKIQQSNMDPNFGRLHARQEEVAPYARRFSGTVD